MGQLRKAIIRKASEPIVEPKDEWDMALDTGLAYPKSQYKKHNPWEEYDRRKESPFQSVEKRKQRRNGLITNVRRQKYTERTHTQRLKSKERRDNTRMKNSVNV